MSSATISGDQPDIINTDVMPYIKTPDWQILIRTILATNPSLDSQFRSCLQYINERRANHSVKGVYPPPNLVFAAMNAIPSPDNVRIVILGQDPYHQLGQAMGLSFSVPKGVKIPPSLRNIYQEQCQDPALPDITSVPTHGDLGSWSHQGVLLLNSALTVEDSRPKSHATKWLAFTNAIIERLAMEQKDIVFMLWGGDAKKKACLIKPYISSQGHLVLESAHPSPLAANKGGWFATRHFSKANEYLVGKGYSGIDWKIV